MNSRLSNILKKIETIIGIGSEILLIEKENVVKDTIERVNEVLSRKSMEYRQYTNECKFR